MKELDPKDPAMREVPARRRLLPRLLAVGCLLVIVAAFLLPRVQESGPSGDAVQADAVTAVRTRSAGETRVPHRRRGAEVGPPAAEIVAGKLSQFARNRHEILQAMAAHFKVEVPEDVRRYFAAAEAGRWEEQTNLFELLKKQRQGADSPEGLKVLWGPIMEAFGVAAEAHRWPAQALLDYGHSILDSLRPGMIYVGGTDAGRFIPTLLNETSDGERHAIFTQNAMADNTYLQYASFLYGDRLPTLTEADSQRAFQDYISDAQKRLTHDQQFPDEPRQIRPGEDVRMADNRVQVSGQVAVMAINERLLQGLMEKNPDASFAIEQSFPFQSTYAGATPLGPIMELRVQDEQNALTRERAAQSIDYWRSAAQQFASDPEAADSSAARQAWSKMALEQAALLADHKYTAEAEQGFQVATELYPASPEAVFRYVNLLLQQNRSEEAAQVAEKGSIAAPDNQQLRSLVEQLRKVKK
jgi:hypothetical protein